MNNMFRALVAASLLAATPLVAAPLTVTQDVNGESITSTFDRAPVAAVSLSHFSTEMMLALGLENAMVGTAFLEEAIDPSVAQAYETVPVLADKWPSLEVFMASRPDFAIGWATAFSKKGVEAQSIVSRDVKIFVPRSTIDFDANLNTLMDDFLTLGKIFNIEDRAEAYVKAQLDELAQIQARMKNVAPKRVFIYDSGDAEAFTVYEGFTTNLFRLVGAENVLAGKGVNKTWGKVSWEDVIAADPELIIVVGYSKSVRVVETDAATKIEWLRSNPLLKNVTAIKNNSFVTVSLADICPGIRNIKVLEKLSNAIHGQ